MKKAIVVMSLAMFGAMTIFSGTALAGWVGKRQHNQRMRIHQGVVSGELTPWETHKLAHEQRGIQIYKAHAWSDGVLGPAERIHLEHMQNRASNHIYHLKHN